MIQILRTSDNRILRTSSNSILRVETSDLFPVDYGLLYNWFAATDSRKISSSDNWEVISEINITDLETYAGGSSIAGGKLKETGYVWWDSPNYGATNELNFNARGSGYRNYGGFEFIKERLGIWTSDDNFANGISVLLTNGDGTTYINGNSDKIVGYNVRLIYTGSGTPTQYVGNDSKSYPVVEIDGKFYTAANLCETRFRNNDIIPWYGAVEADFFTSSEWAALTTAGCCAYNNDVANVGTGFSFPA